MKSIGVIAVFFVFISTNFSYFKERRSRSTCRCSVADSSTSEGEDLYIDDVGESSDGLSCEESDDESDDGAGCESDDGDPPADGAGCESADEENGEAGAGCESSTTEEDDDDVEAGAGCESSTTTEEAYLETEYALGCACASIEDSNESNGDDGYLSPGFYDAPGADETGAAHRDTGTSSHERDAGQVQEEDSEATDSEATDILDGGADASAGGA